MQQSLKSAIRKFILAEREQLGAELRAVRSAAILERLVGLPAYREATAVLGYMNFGTEFASELWGGRALADGKRLALPKVNHHTNMLDLYWVEDFETQLQPGLWGIREPVVERCQRLESLNEVEFALLPGVAFTLDGARLGYGGGFYDKLLSTVRPAVLAVAAFELQLVAQLPQEPTDVKVDLIATEQRLTVCSEK